MQIFELSGAVWFFRLDLLLLDGQMFGGMDTPVIKTFLRWWSSLCSWCYGRSRNTLIQWECVWRSLGWFLGVRLFPLCKDLLLQKKETIFASSASEKVMSLFEVQPRPLEPLRVGDPKDSVDGVLCREGWSYKDVQAESVYQCSPGHTLYATQWHGHEPHGSFNSSRVCVTGNKTL